MHLVMFDIDGTLIDSTGFEDRNYLKAIAEIIPFPVDVDWRNYKHVTDSGILQQIIEVNNLELNNEDIHRAVKHIFIKETKTYISKNAVHQIKGAREFIHFLQQRGDVEIAIATGGWDETARLKLESAGFDLSEISLASSSDHFSRTGIMKIAEKNCMNKNFTSRTYFGDRIWDRVASKKLDYNFVLLGDAYHHSKQILNFEDKEKILDLIGLSL